MLFYERLCLRKIQRKIILRRNEIKDFWQSYYYGVYFPWMPDWNWGEEVSGDRELNQLYFEAEKYLPVDRELDIPKSMLGLAN